ncbi:hypothetical protein [Oceanobacillus bengalensis]|uniref:Uncharacterized protein n=1 Tax=Oceanobacillus bengalensis TaxID=1435466 RepID=A0A494YXB1_9BACI|nr:hypothetical protein [Oceanobacillus bengalensis]RKQ14802.1 hypothetical protein D8M05_12220 [Oceanobacillus bengalensis]
MNVKEMIVFIIGIIISLFGFLLTAIFLIYVLDTDYSLPEASISVDIALGITIGIIPLLFGIFLCSKMRKRAAKRAEDSLENEILKLVAKMNGKITIAELASNTRLSLKDAEERLESFVKMGVSERHISDGGVFVYYFMNILSTEEKNTSQPLL